MIYGKGISKALGKLVNDPAARMHYYHMNGWTDEAKSDPDEQIRLEVYRRCGWTDEAKSDPNEQIRLEAYYALGFTIEALDDPIKYIQYEAERYFKKAVTTSSLRAAINNRVEADFLSIEDLEVLKDRFSKWYADGMKDGDSILYEVLPKLNIFDEIATRYCCGGHDRIFNTNMKLRQLYSSAYVLFGTTKVGYDILYSIYRRYMGKCPPENQRLITFEISPLMHPFCQEDDMTCHLGVVIREPHSVRCTTKLDFAKLVESFEEEYAVRSKLD